MMSFISRCPGLGVFSACSRRIIWAERFSRVVSENCCVIGQKIKVGVVNAEGCTVMGSFQDQLSKAVRKNKNL